MNSLLLCFFVLFVLSPLCYSTSVTLFEKVSQNPELDGPGVGMYTQVRIPPDGTSLPLISYYDAGCGRLKALRCGDSYCQNNNTISIVNGFCPFSVETGRFESQIIGSDGLPFFAYADQIAIVTSHCNDTSCATSSQITNSVIKLKAGTLPETAGYTAAITSTSGTPIVLYVDNTSGLLEIASCNDVLCSTFGIHPVSRVIHAGYPSIALGSSNGNPVISFYNSDKQILQFANCRDRLCRNEIVSIVTIDDSSSDIGRYNYIQIGSDGLPIMMYVDETNGFMKVAHCGSYDCEPDSISITIIDEIGIEAYGEFPEMQINPINGLAVLSYFNQTNSTSGSLKIAQCVDLVCSDALVQVLGTAGCGYGRDSSLSFASNGLIYVSFLNYNPFTPLRKLGLVVLQQSTDDNLTDYVPNGVEYYYSSQKTFTPIPKLFNHLESTLPPLKFDINDICEDH